MADRISKGDKPLPLKYVIITEMGDWRSAIFAEADQLEERRDRDPAQFTFTPPADAKKVEQVHADVTGELSLEAGRMTMRNLHRKFVPAAIAVLAILAADAFVPPADRLAGLRSAGAGRTAAHAGQRRRVARRTTRRVIRRSSIYVATLPAGCVRTSVNGVVVWSCGGAYYQPYGGRYVVVYID